MKRFRVRNAEEVEQQIREQVLFIAGDSVAHAIAWEARLRAAIAALGDFHGHAIDERASSKLKVTVHKTVFENTYLIHYVVNEVAAVVTIINFRHGGRMPGSTEP